MNNRTQRFLTGLLTLLAIILILLGVTIEVYFISLLGFILILVMLVTRYLHIRKLNKQIREIKEGTNVESDDHQD